MTLASWLFLVAQQTTAESAREFSRSMTHHAMAGTHGPVEVMLVVVGVVVVLVTTFYSTLYLIRPGETSADHIKRRILNDGREESR